MISWAPSTLEPWPFHSQCKAAGIEIPTPTSDGYSFLKARLFVHRCRVKDCRECTEARRLGLKTLRITQTQERDGTGLNLVAGALWTSTPRGGLF